LEVKTTLGERREHWISTATQLARTGDRPLYLVSIQLTSAGLGVGWTLPRLVADVRAAVTGSGEPFEAALRHSGYRDRDADLYRSHWALRTSPAFYRIDDQFPALTQDRIDTSVPSAQRITDIRYRIDLSGMPTSPELFAFAASQDRD
jgi:hypothetical protein